MQMKAKNILLGLSIISGFIFIGVSIPLVLEKIGPNDFYGLQLDGEFSSEEDWYRVNRIGGWAMIWAAITLMTGVSILFGLGKNLTDRKFIILFTLIFALSIFIAAIITAVSI